MHRRGDSRITELALATNTDNSVLYLKLLSVKILCKKELGRTEMNAHGLVVCMYVCAFNSKPVGHRP